MLLSDSPVVFFSSSSPLPPPFLLGASASIILYFFYFSSSFSNSFCISYFSVLRCLFLGLLSMFSLFVPGNCCCLPEGFLRCEDVVAAGEYPFFYKGHPPCDATYITYPPGRYFRGEQVFYLPPPPKQSWLDSVWSLAWLRLNTEVWEPEAPTIEFLFKNQSLMMPSQHNDTTSCVC